MPHPPDSLRRSVSEGGLTDAVQRHKEGASYNGHFGSICYHPLFVFNQFGDCEGAMLRVG